ncbi:MAG: hypothetical protein ABI847_05320 [Anaerolineales bacterium]
MEMPTIEQPARPAALNGHAPITYNPVTVQQQDTLGAIFLGLLTFTLLVAYLRAEARSRALQAKLMAAA